jgi:hypothetical protein
MTERGAAAGNAAALYTMRSAARCELADDAPLLAPASFDEAADVRCTLYQRPIRSFRGFNVTAVHTEL